MEKIPFMFTSDALARIVEVTTSLKTRLAIILSVAPRLTDPRSRLEHFTGLFRFVEEKAQVEEAFKLRIQAINGSLFRKTDSASVLSPGGGRGGRGRGPGSLLSAGRGRGGRETSNNIPTIMEEQRSDPKPRVMSMPIHSHTKNVFAAVGGAAGQAQRDSDDDSGEDSAAEPEETQPQSRRPFQSQVVRDAPNREGENLSSEFGKISVDSSS